MHRADGAVRTRLLIRDNLVEEYADVYTPEALAALDALAHFNHEQKAVMAKRIDRRMRRFRNHEPIGFLKPESRIARTGSLLTAPTPDVRLATQPSLAAGSGGSSLSQAG